jgi:2-furoyl-CoA dehydrogenase 2Fe-2S iron sulfur subunit
MASTTSRAESDLRDVTLVVNDKTYHATVECRTTLADALRNELGLTGTHLGCEHGVCGACTVLVDGQTVRACLMLAAQAEDHAITTVEGLAPDGLLNPLQEAFRSLHGLQCGYCTPGILMTLTELLNDEPQADEKAIRLALSGHLCRCTGYQNIVAASLAAVRQARREI